MEKHQYSVQNKDEKILALEETVKKFVQRNDFQNALFVVEKLIKICGQAQDWLIRGLCQIELGLFEEAIESYTQTLKLDPENYFASASLGALFHDIRQYDKALYYFCRAIELKPNDLCVLTNIGASLTNSGRHEKALEILDRVIESDPSIIKAWANRGYALRHLKFYEEEEFDLRITNQIVFNLLHRTEDLNLWQSHIDKLLEIFDKHSISYVLAEGLIESISRLVSLVYQEQKVRTQTILHYFECDEIIQPSPPYPQ